MKPDRIHIYRSNRGVLSHTIAAAEDFGGLVGVAGPIEILIGWHTPAMRRGTDSAGQPCSWYVGTDEAGKILPFSLASPPSLF